MKLDKNTNILIIGLGLIGGSYAMGLTKKGYNVKAISDKKEAIDYALANNIISEGYDYVDEKAVREANLVIFALYPHVFIEWVEKYQHLFSPGTLITDVTGVKGCIVEKIQSILCREGVEFIAAHPMAGREVSGVENSDDKIFRQANYVVTPSKNNTEEAINTCCELGKILEFARISVLSANEHDEIIAFVSQLTHCIAICLMTCQNKEHLEDYTGDSFRDLTRIARLNDEMWSELFMFNRDALISQMKCFEDELAKFRKLLEDGNVEKMREMMRYSTARRALFDKKVNL